MEKPLSLFIVELSLIRLTFNFMVSFRVFLNSNCSIDLTNFWKRFDHSVPIFANVSAILVDRFDMIEFAGYNSRCLI